ncbi:carboxypeptidase-like regulatory domain-containing protein [Flavobacterium lindanitolerans]|jgi:preprotein translocase subunit Sec61beta|uniref:carboxypeptidase-like regulatory domain-containing protein n=1 Tax=Flavobacterium lindanitolerans TaxID=428988 RepID=UPI0023F244E6|nr:carboxypeptidase-like regulatory domain-containing protein [Flavobacterium lindanitolerans]MDQ7959761.1 carboxypeptidase-like regulatory domain-containing protein [Flavobacterium lindanitolerans]
MKSNKILLLTFLVSYVALSQEKIIKGRVVANGNNVEGINLVNLVNEKSAVTDSNGDFSILAKVDDLLVFSAVNMHYKRKIIEADDFQKDIIIIEMEPKINQLDEVEITKYVNITAYNLGIIKFKPKVYTVAERRMIARVGSRAERKARVEGEKKLMLIERIGILYSDEYFIRVLKIDPDYVMAFKYYCSEQPDFMKIVNSRVKDKIKLAIIELARKYNELQNEEIVKE